MEAQARPISIDIETLEKGQTISADLAWNYFITRREETYKAWLLQYGDELTAKAAKISMVLMRVVQWLDRDLRQAELPPLVMTTTGGCINILTDEKASVYLNDQAFSGLRRHGRATDRLINAVDDSKLTASEKRQHENRINVHSFILASSNGAQKQLQRLQKAGKAAPKLL